MDNGGPAFPTNSTVWHCERTGDSGGESAQDGMSLRDYFAGKAMLIMNGRLTSHGDLSEVHMENFVKSCYKIADAMIAERDNHGQS